MYFSSVRCNRSTSIFPATRQLDSSMFQFIENIFRICELFRFNVRFVVFVCTSSSRSVFACQFHLSEYFRKLV